MSHFCTVVFCENPSMEEVGRLMAPYQENNMGDCPKEYLEFFPNDEYDFDPETGKRGYWENPNAKWDYWDPDGRTRGFFRSNRGEKVNAVQLFDMDLSLPAEDREFYEKNWNENHDWLSVSYGTKERYLESVTSRAPWAFVTPDGEWHEKGSMGWWGMSDATPGSIDDFTEKWKAILKKIPQHYYAVALDCHI